MQIIYSGKTVASQPLIALGVSQNPKNEQATIKLNEDIIEPYITKKRAELPETQVIWDVFKGQVTNKITVLKLWICTGTCWKSLQLRKISKPLGPYLEVISFSSAARPKSLISQQVPLFLLCMCADLKAIGNIEFIVTIHPSTKVYKNRSIGEVKQN